VVKAVIVRTAKNTSGGWQPYSLRRQRPVIIDPETLNPRHAHLRPRGARAARQGLYEDCVVAPETL